MRFFLVPLLAASMRSLGIAAVTSPSTFDELINSLGSLGDGKAVTPFGSLYNFITADATGAGNPCARTVRP